MPDYALQTHETAPWHALITAAERCESRCLPADLGRYLATLLMRYIGRPDYIMQESSRAWIGSALASTPPRDPNDLHVLGDRCLVFAGLFPDLASRGAVPVSQYVDIGRQAYARLGQHGEQIFSRLSDRFVEIMDVLQALRELDGGRPSLEPLAAWQLWHDTGSKHAWRALRVGGGLPVRDSQSLVH